MPVVKICVGLIEQKLEQNIRPTGVARRSYGKSLVETLTVLELALQALLRKRVRSARTARKCNRRPRCVL